MIAIIATTLTAATLATDASANGDPVLGALVGAGIGAAIGNSVNHHNGAWVGGAIGAVAGASIAASAGGYYDPAYGVRGRTTTARPRRRTTPRHAVLRTGTGLLSPLRLSCYRPRPVYVGAPYRYAGPVPLPGRPGYGHGHRNRQPAASTAGGAMATTSWLDPPHAGRVSQTQETSARRTLCARGEPAPELSTGRSRASAGTE